MENVKKMKQSGYDWIGSIPFDWNVLKVRDGFIQKKSKACIEDPVVLSLARNGVKVRDMSNSEGQFAASYYEYNPVSVGDMLINPMDLVSGDNCSISDVEGVISPAYVNLRYKEGFNPRYYNYYFKYQYWCMAFFAHGKGVSYENRWTMNSDTLMRFPLIVPSLREQSLIADFLDDKCFEIDGLSSDIQSEIDTLEEYKRSIITEAVTKGLDKNAVLKDSGIEWCPKIPQNWERTNPKALFFQRFDKAQSGEKQLTASQEYGVIYQDEFMEMTGNRVVTVLKDFSILKHVEPGDFVISMRSFQGGLEYSEVRGCISSAYVMLIPNKELVYPPFYRWFFKSNKYINAIQSTSNLVRDGQAMRYANFVQVPLFIIPLDEQKKISDYLEEKVKDINSVLREKKEQLQILSDYKKSVIYEYVTGKKEVPNN